MASSQKSFFLISFLPAVAYWYLEEHYSLKTALIGGIILAVIEMILEKIFTKHIHKISLLNFVLMVALGGISFLGDSGIWFKLQPAFICFFFGLMFTFKLVKNESLMADLMKDMGKALPFSPELFHKLEWRLVFFFYGYALLMGYLALQAPTSWWVFMKTFGFYLSFGLYFIILLFWMRKQRVMNG
jgi:intracellular septation protein